MALVAVHHVTPTAAISNFFTLVLNVSILENQCSNKWRIYRFMYMDGQIVSYGEKSLVIR